MIFDLKEMPGRIARHSRLLGLDLGDKTIGIAISDPGLMVASPLETIARKKFTLDAERLEALIADRNVGGLVFGWPVNMDGSEGPRCQSTRQFVRNMEQLRGFTLPVAFWDERLSTAAIERFLINEADMTRGRRDAVVDKMAAAYILQGALDALAQAKTSQPT